MSRVICVLARVVGLGPSGFPFYEFVSFEVSVISCLNCLWPFGPGGFVNIQIVLSAAWCFKLEPFCATQRRIKPR